MMQMWFCWTYSITDYIIKGLTTHSAGGLFGLCLGVSSMSFAFEFLRYLQAKQRHKELILRSKQLKSMCPTESSTLLAESETSTSQNRTPTITKTDRSFLFGAELSLWFFLQILGYILMLSVMRYNGWLLVAAVIGGGIGYFIFGQMFMKINLKNCQIIRDTWCMQKCGEPETQAVLRDGESTPALETAIASRSVSSCHEITSASVHAECHT